MPYEHVGSVTQELRQSLEAEHARQDQSLMMIASENIASPAVREAQGSMLTNRNVLGYPDSRLYPGADSMDAIESFAIQCATNLWGADHVNVQPHSGSLANLAVYLAVLDPGDSILALDPRDGGHITHGDDRHISSDLYETSYYHVDPTTGQLDYEAIADRAEAVDPDLIISGYSAYPGEIDWPRFQTIADAVDAVHLADIAHIAGIIAADEYPSPVAHADFCTGSTYKTIRGGRGGFILCDQQYADAVDTALFPYLQGGAALPNMAGKAVGFAEALRPEFQTYIKRTVTSAKALAIRLSESGINIVSNGTETHIVVIDLQTSHPDLAGSEAERALEDARIIANKITVPADPRHPSGASGIRFGTSCLVSRGFGPEEMEYVADLIVRALNAASDPEERDQIVQDVEALCDQYPISDTGA
ncbi:serine hydroxymethyltransferase [Halalkalicoccus paucihalophilus]|uniref:Serine hydroxymethyltransferase n=1 Tax=Halalkalicoccus paucihalophilus TaxID=1008153 RepID=A0A151AAF4_9EURY|nr:serine hydroxymethyltransferase [Halalkalicoccus paucihalophilus]KYH24686.1 serine hydroxymethyltransferase [Halalkalicoccus paucihalophilus]